MRFSRLISLLFFITFLAVVYVYQQMEILRFAYLGEKRQHKLQALLDNNNILRYNTGVVSSLPYLDKKLLANSREFEIPQEQKVVRVSLKVKENNAALVRGSKTNLFSKIFNVFTKQAEAKPVSR